MSVSGVQLLQLVWLCNHMEKATQGDLERLSLSCLAKGAGCLLAYHQ